jgi:hypothetical protein
LGIVSTSRIEGAHSSLKNYISNTRRSIPEVVKHINTLLLIQYNNIKSEVLFSSSSSYTFSKADSFFKNLNGNISKNCFHLLFKQFRLLKKKSERYTVCNNSMILTYGIPCHYMMRALYEQGGSLLMENLSAFWDIRKVISNFSDFHFPGVEINLLKNLSEDVVETDEFNFEKKEKRKKKHSKSNKRQLSSFEIDLKKKKK